MNARARILAALNGEAMDRVPITEIGVWPETQLRWQREGMPADVTVEEYFGLDKMALFTYEPSLMLPERILEETTELVAYTDGDGCQYRKFKQLQLPPQFIRAEIDTMEKWEQARSNLKATLSRFEDYAMDFRFGTPAAQSQRDYYCQAIERDWFTAISPTEPCWYFLRLLGEEEALCTMITDPDFVETVISDYTDFVLEMLNLLERHGYRFDALWVFSDMCYRNGMLFSPQFFRERVAPYQKKIFGWAKDRGMKVIYHCDGLIRDFLPLLLEVGVDCVQPLEARAGNDVCDYLDTYGSKLSYIGNINADILAADPAHITEEITRKMSYVKDSNRYIFHSDHSVPPTVSLKNYQHAISVAKSLALYQSDNR